MPHQWILDVLQDLHSYSRLNDLPRLADELDDLIRTASGEIGLTGDAAAPDPAAPPAPGA